MIIRKLQLRNFGKFQNKEILLKEGINIIYGENESGKSTIHSFLQSMFFGIRRMRGKASKTDTYSKYKPWEQGGWYEGSMTFSCGDKQFRLERKFQKSGEETVLFCESDGELLSVKDGDLDMLLGNISETVYRNTVSVGQAKSTTEEGLYKELRDYLAEFQGSGDMRFNPERAIEILKQKRKIQERKEADAVKKKEQEEEKLQYEIQYEKQEAEPIRQKLRELESYRESIQREETEEKPEKQERRKGKTNAQKKWRILGITGLLIFLLLAMFQKLPWYSILIWMVFLAAEEVVFSSHKQEETVINQEPEQEELLRMAKLEERKKMFRENLQEHSLRLENLQEEYQESREHRDEILAFRKEIHDISEAEKRLRAAAANMQNQAGGMLQKKMSEIFSQLTEGKYKQLFLDEDFSVHLDTGEKCLDLYQVSFGTAEQVYLALRLACGEILCREEKMPLILDETFAMYDEKRLSNTLKWIEGRYPQILLFSCNKREIRALEVLNIPYHLVEL